MSSTVKLCLAFAVLMLGSLALATWNDDKSGAALSFIAVQIWVISALYFGNKEEAEE